MYTVIAIVRPEYIENTRKKYANISAYKIYSPMSRLTQFIKATDITAFCINNYVTNAIIDKYGRVYVYCCYNLPRHRCIPNVIDYYKEVEGKVRKYIPVGVCEYGYIGINCKGNLRVITEDDLTSKAIELIGNYTNNLWRERLYTLDIHKILPELVVDFEYIKKTNYVNSIVNNSNYIMTSEYNLVINFPEEVTNLVADKVNVIQAKNRKRLRNLKILRIKEGPTSMLVDFHDSPLEVLQIGTGLKKLNFAQFSGTRITNLDLGHVDTLENINHSCFMNCIYLEKVILPKNIQRISENVFDGCVNLKYIQINFSKEALRFIEELLVSESIKNLRVIELTTNEEILTDSIRRSLNIKHAYNSEVNNLSMLKRAHRPNKVVLRVKEVNREAAELIKSALYADLIIEIIK